MIVRPEVGEALRGGLAIYGVRFGDYPVDPTALFVLRSCRSNVIRRAGPPPDFLETSLQRSATGSGHDGWNAR